MRFFYHLIHFQAVKERARPVPLRQALLFSIQFCGLKMQQLISVFNLVKQGHSLLI
ncbi:hypothetical protein DSOL_2291 [Desulfosporosinus metallidurans]|uniref:Uncharacterized protein n=1 Tax=Desulfosporosinus metallidurans TaxID=1888891 RepID=A0A1Q8QWX1_9FIRM|nr:hypothetical protein DSOL_2291 [Desulfosporosinus metallidurans]